MLIGIPPVLGPDLLFALRSMGHGDEISIVDGNYPAQEHARRLVRADGHGVVTMLAAILKVMPLDQSAPASIFRAAQGNDPSRVGPIHARIDALCADLAPGFEVTPLPGKALYTRIRGTHTTVATSEPELYANIILRKGVIAPPPGN